MACCPCTHREAVVSITCSLFSTERILFPTAAFFTKLRTPYALERSVKLSRRKSFWLPAPFAVQISLKTSASILFFCLLQNINGDFETNEKQNILLNQNNTIPDHLKIFYFFKHSWNESKSV
jgi:hypothetical protein